jgi:hypothetical protein
VSHGKPDLDLIADFVGGALAGTPQERSVGDRIRTDPEWAGAHAELVAALDRVSADLRAFGSDDEPMPDDVWTRLEAALSEPAEPEPIPIWRPMGGPADNRPPSRTARSSTRRRRRWMIPALAAVVVLFALSLGIAALRPFFQGGSGTNAGLGRTDTSGAQAPMSAGAPVLQRSSGRDYTDDTLVLATDFGALPFPSSVDTQKSATGNESVVPGPGVQLNYAVPVPAALTRLTSPDALARCLAAIATTAPGQVLGVDYANYRGTPAAIIVIRTADDARVVAVAGANCGEGGPDLLTQKRVG